MTGVTPFLTVVQTQSQKIKERKRETKRSKMSAPVAGVGRLNLGG